MSNTRKLLQLAASQQRFFSAEQNSAYTRRLAQKACNAPHSIAAIPADSSDKIGDAGAAIRPIGCSRRVFLMNPHLTPDELEGLAYRIRALTNNEYLNSVLIATDDDDPREKGALPAMLLETDEFRGDEDYESQLFDPKPGRIWHAAGGYDPLKWFKSGKYKNSAAVESLLDSVQDLAMATGGDHWGSRIPVITIPHGAVTDSGYALCMSSYVIASEQTHFQIRNLSRGLTFDPVGFSYILPRLGQEFKRPAAKLKGCGYIIALMGHQATPDDMIEIGLATHYMENPTVVMGDLERALALLPPWEHQRVIRTPSQSEAERQRHNYETPGEFNRRDPHLFARNVSLAATIADFADHSAMGGDPDFVHDVNFPARFDFDPIPWEVERESDLVDLAYTFDEIFQNEQSVEGILERFREIAGRKTDDPEMQEGIDVATDLVRVLEEQAPLALKVTHKLMKLGEGKGETLVSCMARERSAQAKMMAKPDFESWGKAQLSISASKAIPTWQHRNVAEVSEDEVAEIIDVQSK